MSYKTIHDALRLLPPGSKILDVWGASAPYKRATHIIDYVPFDAIQYNQVKWEGEVCFSKDTYVQWDICSREPFPYKDKEFDFTICSHVLEDIRDPIWVCSELIRISKAGYIEVPSRIYELTFGIEAKNLAGASHHRWIVENIDSWLTFTFKNFYTHKKSINNKNIPLTDENKVIRFFWNNSFVYNENWLSSWGDMFSYHQGSSLNEKEVRRFFRIISPKNRAYAWISYFYHTNTFTKKIMDVFMKYKK